MNKIFDLLNFLTSSKIYWFGANNQDVSLPTVKISAKAASSLSPILPAAASSPSSQEIQSLASRNVESKQEAVLSKEIDVLMSHRKILIDYLKSYGFVLDEIGYPILDTDHPLESLKKDLLTHSNKVDELAAIFHQIARGGDAGYAHDMRTFLAGRGITSYQVEKGDGSKELKDPIRPHSYVTGREGKEPPSLISKDNLPAYIDLWGNAIWEGYRQYREEKFKIPAVVDSKLPRKISGQDSKITVAQVLHYKVSLERIKELHRTGELLARCANPAEAKNAAAYRYAMSPTNALSSILNPTYDFSSTFYSNDILSTTLLPKENSLVRMHLFGTKKARGFLLDPYRTSSENFALAFRNDGWVDSKDFATLKPLYQALDKAQRLGIQNLNEYLEEAEINLGDGAFSLKAEQERLQILEFIVANGLDIRAFDVKLVNSRQQWEIGKKAINSAQSESCIKEEDNHERKMIDEGYKKLSYNEIYYNEATYYKGVTGDLLVGLFIDSQSSKFQETLTQLFITQDHIRRTKGRFLPIFEFNGDQSQLNELPPSRLLLDQLQLENIPAFEGCVDTQNLEKIGIDRKMLTKGKVSSPEIKYVLDNQLWLFNSDLDFAEKVKFLRDSHLFFPILPVTTSSEEGKKRAFLSSDGLEVIQKDLDIRNLFLILLQKNIEKTLGIKVRSNNEVTFADKKNMFSDVTLPAGIDVKTSYVQAVGRAMQTILSFQVFGIKTGEIVCKIINKIRDKDPSFGYEGHPDTILDAPEVQAILETQGHPAHLLTKMALTLQISNLRSKL